MTPTTLQLRRLWDGLKAATGLPVTAEEQLFLRAVLEAGAVDLDHCGTLLVAHRKAREARHHSLASPGRKGRSKPAHTSSHPADGAIAGASAFIGEQYMQARLLTRGLPDYSPQEVEWFVLSNMPSRIGRRTTSPRNLAVMRYVEDLIDKHGPVPGWSAHGITWKKVCQAWNRGVPAKWRYSDWRNLARDYRTTHDRLLRSAEALLQAHGMTGPTSLPALRRSWGPWPPP